MIHIGPIDPKVAGAGDLSPAGGEGGGEGGREGGIEAGPTTGWILGGTVGSRRGRGNSGKEAEGAVRQNNFGS